MNDQSQLDFEEAPSRARDPSTSHAAADSLNESGEAEQLREKVLDRIKRYGHHGATPDVIAEALGAAMVSVSPRFAVLEREGLIERTGEKRKSLTSNRMRQVWRAI